MAPFACFFLRFLSVNKAREVLKPLIFVPTSLPTDVKDHLARFAGIMADHLITQPTPQPFFDDPQISGLTDKGRAMQATKRGEKVWIVLLKVVKELFILGQAQVTSHDFHRDHFTICQFWGWAFGSQSLVLMEPICRLRSFWNRFPGGGSVVSSSISAH